MLGENHSMFRVEYPSPLQNQFHQMPSMPPLSAFISSSLVPPKYCSKKSLLVIEKVTMGLKP